jgi:signal transduction histidine kinase
MFRSIRTKLAVSYALIIVLCLLLAGLGAVVLINRYQRDAVLTRVRAASSAITQPLQALLTQQVRLPQIESRLSQEVTRWGMRALLIGPNGLVLADTAEDDALTGERIQIPAQNLPEPGDGIVVRRYVDPEGQRYILAISPLRPPPQEAASSPWPRQVIMAVPEEELQPAWRELARPLATAGLASLLLSAIVAALLSRSITQPLIAMTNASTRIAQGDYKQVILTQGQDEVARLADSFNRMAHEVERSRQAQRDFLANVSHDLKTPLTSIQGFSQAMLEGAIHDEQGYERAAQIINEEAAHMGRLIQQLLSLARLEGGGTLTERMPIAPGELVKQVAEKLGPLVVEAKLEMKLSVSPDLPTIYGDEEHLEQAFSNLIDNAIKYTPAGGHIAIDVQQTKAKGGRVIGQIDLPCAPPKLTDGLWVAICVKDTGSGISPEELPFIFERFYRADKSRGRAGGLGLGLAIAKEIVEAHGGVVAVHSEQGKGSCFSVLLPVGSEGP